MPTFKKYKKSQMKCANEMSDAMISIPIYPELNNTQQNKVINTIIQFFKNK